MNAAILEFVKEDLAVDPGQSEMKSVSVVVNKFEALKILATALLREIEALEKADPREQKQICLQDEMRRFEADVIRCALIRTGGRQRRAARLLGMNVATLNLKIKRYILLSDVVIGNAHKLRLEGQ